MSFLLFPAPIPVRLQEHHFLYTASPITFHVSELHQHHIIGAVQETGFLPYLLSPAFNTEADSSPMEEWPVEILLI